MGGQGHARPLRDRLFDKDLLRQVLRQLQELQEQVGEHASAGAACVSSNDWHATLR